MSTKRWKKLNDAIISCRQCPRLIEYCHGIGVEKRRAYLDWNYWAKPVPNFGDPRANVLIVGLAPAAHGANRTGRMFTGDRSGDWLFRALNRAGFANQAQATNIEDGLKLHDCAITAACHCAPPDNRPSKAELTECRSWLNETIELVSPKVMLSLGQIGWNSVFDWAKRSNVWNGARPRFGHGAEQELANQTVVLGCYHPSQQNTFTGRLTEAMLDSIFDRARHLVDDHDQ